MKFNWKNNRNIYFFKTCYKKIKPNYLISLTQLWAVAMVLSNVLFYTVQIQNVKCTMYVYICI